jgi:predicted dehydrogenase
MINLATVGTGDITEKFLSACRLTDRYEFHTAYSRSLENGEKFAKKQGFKHFSDNLISVAKSPEIDTVYMATPNVFHYEQSKLFLENGKNVICEKPITTDCKKYDELLALANEKALIYAEAIMSRHSAGREILLDALSQIGKISQARIDYCQLSSRYEKFKKGERVNIFDMSLAAGTLMDLGVYCVYAALDLLGKPDTVSASAAFADNGADLSGGAVLGYKDFTAVLSYSKIGQSAIGSEIVGDSGAIKIGSISQYADISLVKNGKEALLLGIPDRAEVMRGEAEKFADYIENRDAFLGDYKSVCELTHNVHTCMDLIKQSAKIEYPIKE